VIDGVFATPHRQACRIKRTKFALIAAKKFLLPIQIHGSVIVIGSNSRLAQFAELFQASLGAVVECRY
jgi:hypothetical protein